MCSLDHHVPKTITNMVPEGPLYILGDICGHLKRCKRRQDKFKVFQGGFIVFQEATFCIEQMSSFPNPWWVPRVSPKEARSGSSNRILPLDFVLPYCNLHFYQDQDQELLYQKKSKLLLSNLMKRYHSGFQFLLNIITADCFMYVQCAAN